MPGDGQGWALDEDRRQMRAALKDVIHETNILKADVIHTPFWQGLSGVAPEILKQTFVIAHADNPPFFYLKQPEFLLGQQQVDLWVARSQQALKQFQALQLPVIYIPYTIDPALFFPINDKKQLRQKFGIPLDRYVIANFHRDTEGADLITPKLQKAPELMFLVLKKLKERGAPIHVLLAGPRRHWLRKQLQKENIPYTFVGEQEISGDDFGVNILDRVTLNELTNAADLYLIPSRWEGGPQSVMEAAACRCKVLSTPLGVACDILEPASLFHTAAEAVDRILSDINNNDLEVTLQPQWERWSASHTTASMEQGLQQLYKELPKKELFQKKKNLPKSSFITRVSIQLKHLFKTRLAHQALPQEIGWNHQPGKNRDLDEILLGVRKILNALGIKISKATGSGIEFVGWPSQELPPKKKKALRLQWIVPGMPEEALLPDACFIAPSVQDVLNLRKKEIQGSSIVLSLPLIGEKSDEPLTISENNDDSSIKIWRAMAAGRPVIYPTSSAYYEQVFHGGISYQNETDLSRVIAEANETVADLQSFLRPPTMKNATKALRQLLKELLKFSS